jgi:hypothetical protein
MSQIGPVLVPKGLTMPRIRGLSTLPQSPEYHYITAMGKAYLLNLIPREDGRAINTLCQAWSR